MHRHILRLDEKLNIFFKNSYIPVARFALFVVFFWFGAIKFTGLSPADEIARVLTEKTIGLAWFDLLFHITALLECVIGILILIPKAVRIVIPLLFAHMLVVSAPLIMVPEITWHAFMVPTLEGQYIIKNVAIVALAFGIAAHTKSLRQEIREAARQK